MDALVEGRSDNRSGRASTYLRADKEHNGLGCGEVGLPRSDTSEEHLCGDLPRLGASREMRADLMRERVITGDRAEEAKERGSVPALP
tara:strand:- start:3722 stop:3985 length:264 start_codon:yes stop_codon:yes gene_type:complete